MSAEHAHNEKRTPDRTRRPHLPVEGERREEHPIRPAVDTVFHLQRMIGNQAVQRWIAPNAGAEPAQAAPDVTAAPRSIQRFGSLEHQELGDKGSGGGQYDFGGGQTTVADPTRPAAAFRLTHGDIVMLSGDYFDPRDTLPDGNPNPDALFLMANKPSPDPGKTPGTQDEIIYAIKDINPNDPRFAVHSDPANPAVGMWGTLEFSQAVKDAVGSRYKRLAAVNDEHFANPQGGTANGPMGMKQSAGGSYRALHEEAVQWAFGLGQSGGDIGEAMAREAAAQHFLTDHFAAGHLRTPRTSIRDFWQKKYPLFFGNIKKKIALDVARYINEHDTNIATVFGTVSVIYDRIYAQVQEKTADLPEITFGELVASVAHDVDNEQGLWVVNEAGDQWKSFGDSNLHNADPANRTAEIAERAVRMGCDDITFAFNLGRSTPGPWSNEFAQQAVKARSGKPAQGTDKYAPEQLLPQIDTSKPNGTQTWEADSLDDLWTRKVRDDKDMTYGDEFIKSAKSGEIHGILNGMAAKFPTMEGIGYGFLGVVFPKQAFTEGFVKPIEENPLVGLRNIIDYNPSEGQSFFNEDDAVMEELEGMKPGEINGLTLNQRADRIKALIGGYTGDDEGETVIQLFQTAPAAERAQLYRLEEGHAWTGEWIEGVFVSDDDIWNALSKGQLNRLQDIINGN